MTAQNGIQFNFREKRLGFNITPTNRKDIEFTKLKGNYNSCNLCKTTIPKGSFCMGKSYCKVCLSCAEKSLKNVFNDLEAIKMFVEARQIELNENRDKWSDKNMIAKLKEKPNENY